MTRHIGFATLQVIDGRRRIAARYPVAGTIEAAPQGRGRQRYMERPRGDHLVVELAPGASATDPEGNPFERVEGRQERRSHVAFVRASGSRAWFLDEVSPVR
jgi:hypothetical protein